MLCVVFDLVARVRNLEGSGFTARNAHDRLPGNNEKQVYFFCFIFASHTDKTPPYNIVCFKMLCTVSFLLSTRRRVGV